MQYREYGNTGKMISALGFGAMRLPKDEDYAVEVIQRYLDLGGNLIDTARAYSNSEKLVGQAVQGRRDQVYLSTKNHAIEHGRHNPELWKQYMEESFKALGVDHIDFYHVHNVTWESVAGPFQEPGGPLEICQQALDEGIIGHLCFSSHDSPENIIKIIDTDLFDGMIVQYNILDSHQLFGADGHKRGTSNEPAIAHAHEKGMGVLIMGPVAGGRLVMGQSQQLKQMLTESTTSVPDLAIRFVLANPGVTAALSGMNTIQMVEENVASASHEQPLTEHEYQQIRAIVERNEKLAELYCTGCNYCQPCPQGVAIPKIFEAMNYHRVWGLTEHAKNMYRKLEINAEACVECGECEEKCPQHIPIIKQLKETHQTLSD